jgi:hypothetical protein
MFQTDVVSEIRLLVMANVVAISPILVTLMMKTIHSYETSVPTRAIRRNIPADGILHSHRRENLRSYKTLSSVGNKIRLVSLI